MIPPNVSQLGSFDTTRYRIVLAAYPFQVRVGTSVQGRTRTGTIWVKIKMLDPHGLRLSKIIPQLTLTAELTGGATGRGKKAQHFFPSG